MPQIRPLATTGTCRYPRSFINCSASMAVPAGEIVSGLGVMTSANVVVDASLPCATTLQTTSCAVKMPSNRRSGLATNTAPTSRVRISTQASSPLVSGGRINGSCPRMTSDMRVHALAIISALCCVSLLRREYAVVRRICRSTGFKWGSSAYGGDPEGPLNPVVFSDGDVFSLFEQVSVEAEDRLIIIVGGRHIGERPVLAPCVD